LKGKLVSTTSRSLSRTLTAYALALAYAVAIIIGILLTIQDRDLTKTQVLSAVGLNIISSVIFAIIFVTLSSRAQGRDLKEDLGELFNEHADRLLDRISEGNRTYYPSVQYPPSKDFNEIFNRDLTNSLEGSNYYFFRGPSPRYLPARISAAKRGPSRVHVAMLDPTSTKALTRRAADRRQRPGFREKTIDELVCELREELLMSIVALFDCRNKCPIQIIYTLDTAVTRAEISDDSLYISWYHSPTSPGTIFPETLRFPAGSVLYETLKLDIARQFEIFHGGMTFDSSHSDGDLIAHLQKLTGDIAIDGDSLALWRNDYLAFIGRFEALLAGLYNGSL
jgi:hypothetical protein